VRDASGYVFLDESGVTTDLLRRYGRSLRGVRLRDHTPCSHWQTHTVIAALRTAGVEFGFGEHVGRITPAPVGMVR